MLNGLTEEPTTELVFDWAKSICRQTLDVQLGSEQIHPRSNPSSISWIVSATANESVVRIFIKHHHDKQMFEREVMALTTLRKQCNSTIEGTFPKLLGTHQEFRLLAMTWIDGQPIGPILRKAVSRFGRKSDLAGGREAAFGVGSWLKDLENATKMGESPYPSQVVLQRIDELIHLISRDAILRRSELSEVRSVSIQLGNAVKSRYIQALSHCDFWFDHILLDKSGTVAVLDYGRSIYSLCGRDAVEFILRLQDLGVNNPIVSQMKIDQLKRAFLVGYGDIDIAEPGLRLFMILRRLEQLGGLVEKKPIHFLDKVRLRNQKSAIASWIRQHIV
jgi:hypothetical protein